MHLLYTGAWVAHELGRWIFKPITNTACVPPDFVNYKKGALDSQPQVIKFTSCLPMVGDSLWLPPPLKLVAMTIAEILLKVALKHQKSNQSNQII
jgi:hypothetical protein